MRFYWSKKRQRFFRISEILGTKDVYIVESCTESGLFSNAIRNKYSPAYYLMSGIVDEILFLVNWKDIKLELDYEFVIVDEKGDILENGY